MTQEQESLKNALVASFNDLMKRTMLAKKAGITVQFELKVYPTDSTINDFISTPIFT